MKNKLLKLMTILYMMFILISNCEAQFPLTLVKTADPENKCQGSYQFIDETEHDWTGYSASIYHNNIYNGSPDLNNLILNARTACAGNYKIEIVGPKYYDPIAQVHTTSGCFSGKAIYFTIEGDCPIEINPDVTGICENEEDNIKTVTLEIEGGEEPYFISWSNGTIGNYMETMESGMYTVTVEDSNGCSVTDNVIIDNKGSEFGYTYEIIPMSDDFKGELNITFYNNYPPLNVNGFYSNRIVGSGELLNYSLYWGPLAGGGQNVVDLNITNNSGCEESVSFTIPDCRTLFTDPFSIGYILSNNDLGAQISNIQGGVPPYDVLVKRIKKNNTESNFTAWQTTVSHDDNSNITVDVPVEGKYLVSISDQCKNRISKELYLPTSTCEYEISNSENENTHYYVPSKDAIGQRIVFEAICGCNEQCTNLAVVDKDPYIDIKHTGIPFSWGNVIITWPVIPGYQNDENTTTTTYFWDGGSLEHTGRDHFSLGNYLDDKTQPIELEVKVNITGLNCIVEIPMTFSPSESVEQLNFNQVKESTGSWFELLEDYNIWDDGYFQESLLINSKCEDCYTSSEGVIINGECGINYYFVYNPNNPDNPCNGGGTLETYNYDDDNNITKEIIIVPAGAAFKEYKLNEMGIKYSWTVASCDDGGGCLFSSTNIFDFPLLNDDNEPYLIFTSYCNSGEDIVDNDGDYVDDEGDNCKNMPNPAQFDYDNDGVGDACDNCVKEYNPGQEDDDQDGKGNVCDTWDIIIEISGTSGSSNVNDSDGDGVIDILDNCVNTPNPLQIDSDGNGLGDKCDCQTIPKMTVDGFCYNTIECPNEDPIDGPQEECVYVKPGSCNFMDNFCYFTWEVPADGNASLTFKRKDNGEELHYKSLECNLGTNSYKLYQEIHLNNYGGVINAKINYTSEALGNAVINYEFISVNFKSEKDNSSTRNSSKENFEALIFPNPASNSLTVTSLNELNKIYIFSIDGRIVLERLNLSTNTTKFNLDQLNSGLYFIKILSEDNKSIVKKLVVEK